MTPEMIAVVQNLQALGCSDIAEAVTIKWALYAAKGHSNKKREFEQECVILAAALAGVESSG